VLNTARQLGGSLGVAMFGAIVAQAGFLPGLRISASTAAKAKPSASRTPTPPS
jgi:DHA2 family methylenomycin A resistance protein-like MFS transporter